MTVSMFHQNICKQQPLLSTEWIKFYSNSTRDNFKSIFQKKDALRFHKIQLVHSAHISDYPV